MMNKYNTVKNLTDKKLHALEAHILTIRQRSQKLIERHSDLCERKHDLMQQNGGSDIKGSDEIYINVGGTEMFALRETLTKIKGSRLEALFSGRLENKLLRDEQGRVFIDMDVYFFKKIVEHLHSAKTSTNSNEVKVSDWPRLSGQSEQKTLDLYIDLFRLRQTDNDNTNGHQSSPIKRDNDRDESFDDLLDTIKMETQELDEFEKNLDKMEKDLEEEVEFVSFFTTPDPIDEKSESGSDYDTDDAISFASLSSSDTGLIVSSSTHQKQNDTANNHIVNLWIDREIIAVKRSTLCITENSTLAKNFNDDAWVNKHTVTTKDGAEVVLMGYSSVILSIINQLRLRSMMVDVQELPRIVEVNKVESVESVVSKLFPGNEKFVLGESKFDSEIITPEFDYNNQLITWLEEVNRRSEPKLLYRATRDGWTAKSFHSLCDDSEHTFVIVKTKKKVMYMEATVIKHGEAVDTNHQALAFYSVLSAMLVYHLPR